MDTSHTWLGTWQLYCQQNSDTHCADERQLNLLAHATYSVRQTLASHKKSEKRGQEKERKRKDRENGREKMEKVTRREGREERRRERRREPREW